MEALVIMLVLFTLMMLIGKCQRDELEDGIYKGNLNAWIWRAQHAECTLDDLKDALRKLKRHYGIDYEYSEVPWVKGTDIDKLL